MRYKRAICVFGGRGGEGYGVVVTAWVSKCA